jgi:hypothetical protein
LNHRIDQPNRTQALLLVLLCLVAFFASSAVIRQWAPEPNVVYYSERMAAFAPDKDDYTVLFVGSSRFRSAIDPALFDTLTSGAGHPTRSFNFGLPGLRLQELDYVVRQIRDLKPAALEWVFIEPWFKVNLKPANLKKRRVIHYHDLPATLLALRTIRHLPPTGFGRLYHSRQILQHFAYRETNQGLALSLIGDFYRGGSPARVELMQRVAEGRGYYKREGSTLHGAERRRYEGLVAEWPSIYRRQPLAPDVAHQLAPTIRQVETTGARPVILFAPSTAIPFELVLPGEAAAPIIRLDDIDRHPELFAREHRWDVEHTNHRGAQLTTTALADAFLQLAGEGAR